MPDRTFADLPSIDGPPADADPKEQRKRWPTGWNRRQMLQASLGAAMFLSLSMVAKLPPARAGHPGSYGYRIKGLPCPGYADCHNCHHFDSDRANCGHGCGPSPVKPRACETSLTHHKWGWHRNDNNWALRPGDCTGGGNFDGWKWRYNTRPCGSCNDAIVYRCHDGFDCRSGGCDPSICRWTVQCR